MTKSENLLRRTAAVVLAVLLICGSVWSMAFASESGAEEIAAEAGEAEARGSVSDNSIIAGSVSDNSAEPQNEPDDSAGPQIEPETSAGLQTEPETSVGPQTEPETSAGPQIEPETSAGPAAETVSDMETRAALVGSGPAAGTENSPNFLTYLGLAARGEAYFAFLQKYSSENSDTGFFMGTPYTNTVNMPGSDITTSGFRGAWFMASPRGHNRQGINTELANRLGEKYRGGMNCTGFGTALFSRFGTEQGINVDGLLPGKRQNGDVLAGFMGYDWNYFMPGNPGYGSVKMYLFAGGGRSGSRAGNWEAAKQEMLGSGVLEYGDIIYSLPLDTEKQVSGSMDTHWGIYLGDGSSDVYWHSAYSNDLVNTVGQLVNTSSTNIVTQVVPKYANVTFAVIKVGAMPTGNGYLQVRKEVRAKSNWAEHIPAGADVTYFIGCDYETEGTVYKAYTDAACTKEAGTLTIGPNDDYNSAMEAKKYTAFSNVIELPAGRYYVKEYSTPNENLEEDQRVYTADVTAYHTVTVPCVVTSTDYPKFGWLKIIKQSADPTYKAGLEGAEFTVYKGYDEESKSCVGKIGTVTTREDGTTDWFQIPLSDVWILETKAPEGYAENKTPVHVEGLIAGWDARKTVTVDETPFYAKLLIKKSSSREIPEWLGEEDRFNYYRKGAVYHIYRDTDRDGKSTELIKTVETVNYHGETDVFELPIGHYFAVEDKAPANYVLNQKNIPFDVTAENCYNNPAVVSAPAREIEAKDEPFYARLKIRKASSAPIPDWVEDRTRYYRDGALYEIYYDPDRDGKSETLAASVRTVTVSGSSEVFELPIGHYFAIEVEGPTNGGYKINEDPVPFDVTADNCSNNPAAADIEFVPVDTVDEIIFGGLRIEKVPDEDAGEFAGGSSYLLKGAEFSVYSSATLEDKYLVGTLETGESGRTDVLTGLAPGTYYVVETKAPAGFGLPADDFTAEKPHVVTITAKNLTELITVTCREPALYSSAEIKIRKEDAASGNPVGGAVLEGAQFEIRYYDGYYEKKTLPEKAARTWTVQAVKDKETGEYYASLSIKGSLIKKLSDELYQYNGKVIIPCGTLVVEETVPPEGYRLPDDPVLMVKQINNKSIMAEASAGALCKTIIARDEVIRGGFSFVKTDQDGNVMAGVPFTVTSVTTGEQHVIVTDGSGCFSTENNAHSRRTNAGDSALSGGVLDETKLDPEAGVWFTGSKESKEPGADDSRGALPYDEYILTELRSSANAGRRLIEPVRFSIESDGTVIDLGKFVNISKTIATRVRNDRTGTQTAPAKKNAAFTDTVILQGFAGECVIRTSVFAVGTGEKITLSGGAEEVVTKVRADGKETEVNVALKFDASLLAGKTAAVVTAVENEGETIVHNADLSDPDEKIYVPKLITGAVNAATGRKTVPASERTEVCDRVSFSGFKPGETMSTVTEAWVKGDTPADDILLESAENSHTAESGSGSYEVSLVLNTKEYGGRDIYIVEKNSVGGVPVAEEGGRENEMQTVTVVDIGTTLTDAETLTHISLADSEVTNIDRVSYSGLEAGRTYPVIGILMNADGYAWRKDGTVYEEVRAEELNSCDEGQADDISGMTPEEKMEKIRERLENLDVISAYAEFTAEEREGCAEVTFIYNGIPLAGQKVVAGETVYEAGEVLAVHFVPEDEGQAVYLPKIVTTAANTADGSRYVSESRTASITDTLYYEGYPEGARIRTVLQLFDADTGEALTVNGEPVTAEKIFSAEGCGEISVDVVFDSTGLGNIRIGLEETNYVEAEDVWVPCAVDSFRENEKQIVTHVMKEETPTPSILTPTPSTAAPKPSVSLPEPSVSAPKPSGIAPAPSGTNPGSLVRTGDNSRPLFWMIAALLAAIVLKTLIKSQKR